MKKQILDLLHILLKSDHSKVSLQFVRHSPGRRRGSDQSLYDVCTDSKASASMVKAAFAQFRRKDNPLPRPPELKDINVFPLVSITSLFSDPFSLGVFMILGVYRYFPF